MSKKYNTEAELVESAKQGDKTALTEIVLRNEKLVYNTALRLLANTDEAECVLQETFLKVFQALPDFKGESQLSTWIYRIATNYALMRLRSKKKLVSGLDDIDSQVKKDTLETFNKSVTANPLSSIMNDELRREMEGAIAKLAPKFRTVFVLKDIEGQSLQEIAEMTGMSLAAVKSNLHRARLFLRKQLAEFIESENNSY
ncbi:MAG TPA: sigma-70 family RNA polymerase sigma factor [bacterium]|nr:sigma-70 family RNA polymerase sigma factor [bacterium]HPN44496.1 sigma-70 family RNA polymerase sigma factor [bacterium]